MKRVRLAAGAMALLALCACAKEQSRTLGTLEWDRITLPAPAAEKIISIEVREGQRVGAGDVLLRLEAQTTESQLAAAAAQQRRNDAALEELRAGPRSEEIARAHAILAAAEAQATDAQAQFRRAEDLLQRNLIARAEVDRARAANDSAAAEVRAARAALTELERGTRREQIAQGEAAVAAAAASATTQRALLDKLTLTAPRDAVVDSLPYRLGDQAPVGAPLAILLAGDAPYARVYVPESLRAQVKVGTQAQIKVEGSDQTWPGTVRMIRSDPVFTPYYALTGQDVSRLSYLAEIQLGAEAGELPAGLPLSATFTP